MSRTSAVSSKSASPKDHTQGSPTRSGVARPPWRVTLPGAGGRLAQAPGCGVTQSPRPIRHDVGIVCSSCTVLEGSAGGSVLGV